MDTRGTLLRTDPFINYAEAVVGPKDSRASSCVRDNVPSGNVWDDINGRPGLGGGADGALGGDREPRVVMAPLGVGITASNPSVQSQPSSNRQGLALGHREVYKGGLESRLDRVAVSNTNTNTSSHLNYYTRTALLSSAQYSSPHAGT